MGVGPKCGAGNPADLRGNKRHGGLTASNRYFEHYKTLPVVETEVAQLGPGPPDMLSTHLHGRDVFLSHVTASPELAVSLLPAAEWVALLFASAKEGDLGINGHVLQRSEVFLSHNPNGYSTTGKGRDVLGIAVRRERLQLACAALLAICPSDVRLSDHVLHLGDSAASALRQRLMLLIGRLGEAPAATATSAVLPLVFENEIVEAAAHAVLPSIDASEAAQRQRVDPLKVIRASEQVTRASFAAPPSIVELCGAAGVRETRLFECFAGVYGVPPLHVSQEAPHDAGTRMAARSNLPGALREGSRPIPWVSLQRSLRGAVLRPVR